LEAGGQVPPTGGLSIAGPAIDVGYPVSDRKWPRTEKRSEICVPARGELEALGEDARRKGPSGDLLGAIELQLLHDPGRDSIPTSVQNPPDSPIGGHYCNVRRAMEMRQLNAHGDDQVVERTSRAVVPLGAPRDLIVVVHRRNEIDAKDVITR